MSMMQSCFAEEIAFRSWMPPEPAEKRKYEMNMKQSVLLQHIYSPAVQERLSELHAAVVTILRIAGY